MARKTPMKTRAHVSTSRAGRLYRLLQSVVGKPVPRLTLIKKLRVGMRTFYRDVDLLRECGIAVETEGEGYRLAGDLNEALHKLPFPDPELTFGDMSVLMKGKSPTHAKIRQLFAKVTK